MFFSRTTGLHIRLIIVLTLVLVVSTACDWTQFRFAPGHSGVESRRIDLGGHRAQLPAEVGGHHRRRGRQFAGDRRRRRLRRLRRLQALRHRHRHRSHALVSHDRRSGGVLPRRRQRHGLRRVGRPQALRLPGLRWTAALVGHRRRHVQRPLSAPTVNQGLIWVTTSQGLYAFQTNGALQRATPIVTSDPLSPPSIANNLVFTASYADATLWAFHIDTAALAWSATVPGPRASCTAGMPRPATNAGVVYVGFAPRGHAIHLPVRLPHHGRHTALVDRRVRARARRPR